MKKILLLSLLLGFTVLAQTQSKPSPVVPGSENSKLREVYSAKIEFLRSVLDLNQKEADLFWPVYSEYLRQRDLFSTKKKSCMTGLNNYISGNKTYTESNVKRLLDLYSFYDDEIVRIDKAFYSDIQKILPTKKIALYYKADEDFRVKMIQQLKGSKP